MQLIVLDVEISLNKICLMQHECTNIYEGEKQDGNEVYTASPNGD